MSREDVLALIIEPMRASYLPPRADMRPEEIALALQAYTTALKSFPTDALSDAWTDVVATHRGRNWPVPAVIVLAATKAARDRRQAKADAEPKRDFAAERERYWRACCKSDKAMRAAEASVAWALKCAILDEGKSLYEINLQAFVDAQASAERVAARLRASLPLYAKDGRLLGVMSPKLRDEALGMYEGLKACEARARAEVLDAQGDGARDGAQTPS
jgi:hypothetical protein